MDYEIVSYAPEFDAQIIDVQRHLWSGDPGRNAAYFRWKYRDNPFFDETLIRLALSGGRVVGMRGMFGTLWEVDGAAPRALPCAEDLVVAPEHRNRGVVTRIMNAVFDDLARRGFPFAFSLSAGPVTFVGSLAGGWRSVGSFRPVGLGETAPRMGRVRALARRVPLLRRVNGALRALRSRAGFRHLDSEGSRSARPVSLAREPRTDAMAELVARLPWDGRIRHVRSSAYFAWRFRNPLHEYRFLYRDGAGLEGYLVLQRSLSDRADAARINIADWEATDERVRAELLAAALDWGRFSRVRAWTVSAAEATRGLLQARGFAPLARDDVRRRSEGLLLRRPAGAAGPWVLGSRAVLDIENWDLRMLYSMSA